MLVSIWLASGVFLCRVAIGTCAKYLADRLTDQRRRQEKRRNIAEAIEETLV